MRVSWRVTSGLVWSGFFTIVLGSNLGLALNSLPLCLGILAVGYALLLTGAIIDEKEWDE